jgi:hypothetical protein
MTETDLNTFNTLRKENDVLKWELKEAREAITEWTRRHNAARDEEIRLRKIAQRIYDTLQDQIGGPAVLVIPVREAVKLAKEAIHLV